MNLEEAKQYCDLILEETNILKLKITIGESNEGIVQLQYTRKTREFDYLVAGEVSQKKPSEKIIVGIISNLLDQK